MPLSFNLWGIVQFILDLLTFMIKKRLNVLKKPEKCDIIEKWKDK